MNTIHFRFGVHLSLLLMSLWACTLFVWLYGRHCSPLMSFNDLTQPSNHDPKVESSHLLDLWKSPHKAAKLNSSYTKIQILLAPAQPQSCSIALRGGQCTGEQTGSYPWLLWLSYIIYSPIKHVCYEVHSIPSWQLPTHKCLPKDLSFMWFLKVIGVTIITISGTLLHNVLTPTLKQHSPAEAVASCQGIETRDVPEGMTEAAA